MKQSTKTVLVRLIGVITTAIVMLFFSTAITGTNSAVMLAHLIGLPNSYLLAALLGGLLGLWLSLGGPRRIAGFAGWLIGVFTAWLLWQAGVGYVWVIETILVAGFGPEAAAFTSLATFMLLFSVMRWAAGIGAKAVAALLSWGVRWDARRILERAVAGQKSEQKIEQPLT